MPQNPDVQIAIVKGEPDAPVVPTPATRSLLIGIRTATAAQRGSDTPIFEGLRALVGVRWPLDEVSHDLFMAERHQTRWLADLDEKVEQMRGSQARINARRDRRARRSTR